MLPAKKGLLASAYELVYLKGSRRRVFPETVQLVSSPTQVQLS
jgi:hypothetical protein